MIRCMKTESPSSQNAVIMDVEIKCNIKGQVRLLCRPDDPSCVVQAHKQESAKGKADEPVSSRGKTAKGPPMSKKLQAVRGTHSLYGPDADRFHKVISAFEEI